jgi:hypothetical protein
MILLFVGLMILGAAVVSGCLKSSEDDDEEENGSLFEKGNTWVYTINDADFGEGEMTVTVKEESKMFEGHEVVVLEFEYSYGAFYNEDEEMYYDAWTGSSVSYFRKADFEVVYDDYEWELKGREDPTDEWSTSGWEGERTITFTGTIPSTFEAGNVYTLEETTVDDFKIYSNGSLVMEETSDNTLTKTYSVIGEKEVTVPAGTLTCWEIRVEDDMDEDGYTLKYFCPELNIDVKIVEYYDDKITSTHELIST